MWLRRRRGPAAHRLRRHSDKGASRYRAKQRVQLDGREPMLNWSITFLIIGLIAGVLGFSA
jgi:hypothetical protein